MAEIYTGSKGRPRSVAAEAAILKAATELMDELRPSYISAESIAKRAGVSKATLYKWWPTKTHILLDAILLRAVAEIPLPDTGSTREDFILLLRGFIHFHKSTSFGVTVAHLFAEGMNDPTILALYNERYALPRRAQIRVIWERGVTRGDLRAEIDPELGLDMLYGPIVYRYLVNHAPLDESFADHIVAVAFDGANHGTPG